MKASKTKEYVNLHCQLSKELSAVYLSELNASFIACVNMGGTFFVMLMIMIPPFLKNFQNSFSSTIKRVAFWMW